ncbi:MAG: helix-turn-helix domain-containing protein [Bacteroidetes bacterium]|nr:helix-turn-helix domain-containing protein [Fibrella sp.]
MGLYRLLLLLPLLGLAQIHPSGGSGMLVSDRPLRNHADPPFPGAILSACLVTCMLQDREGVTWFGTCTGSNEYDRQRFASLLPSLKNPIPGLRNAPLISLVDLRAIRLPGWSTSWLCGFCVLLVGVAAWGLVRFCTNRIRQRHTLELNRQEAEHQKAIDDLKIRVFSITHQFSTPLSLMLSPVEKLLQDPHTDAPTRQTLGLVQRNVAYLLQLIGQLPDMSSPEASGTIVSPLRDVAFSVESVRQRVDAPLITPPDESPGVDDEDGLREFLPGPITTVDDAFLHQVYKLLEEHLRDPSLDVDWLADQLAMSRKTLYRKIHALVQLAPNELIRQHRLRKAADLLRAGHSVSQTAYLVGFKTPSYFTLVFKEFYLKTPTEFATTGCHPVQPMGPYPSATAVVVP